MKSDKSKSKDSKDDDEDKNDEETISEPDHNEKLKLPKAFPLFEKKESGEKSEAEKL